MERRILRQSAIILARVLAFVEIADLISGGSMSMPEAVQKLAERYSFQKFPRTFEELDISKGIEFLEGKSAEHPIRKFVIWDSLLVLETRINTNVSKAILEGILSWGVGELGINFQPDSIKRYGYVSDVTFFSDAPLLTANPAVTALAKRSSDELSRIWQQPVQYEPLSVRVGHDPTTRKYPLAPFSIEHRSESRFSENKYYSEAPLPTDIHWEMLEQYEKDILLDLGKAHRVGVLPEN
jgi:hypothetical protein